MFVTVLAAEADGTRQTVTFLIGCLVGIAGLLTLLTVWYWFHTDPKRRPVDEVEPLAQPLLDELRQPAVPSGDRAEPPAGPSEPIEPSVGAEPGSEPEPAAAPEPGTQPRPGSGPEPDTLVPAEPIVAARAVESAEVPLLARQTWDFVAAARRAEEVVDAGRSAPAAAPRIDVPDRAPSVDDEETGDELAVVRRRRERATEGGLTDEAWRSVQRAAFKELDG